MARNPLIPGRPGGQAGLFDPFLSLHRDVNRMFDDLYRGGSRASPAGSELADILDASLDVSETETEYRVSADLPGVRKEDIDIRLDDDVLTIQGEKRFEREEGGEKEDYHVVERAYGTFRRSIRLPRPIDADKVGAVCENGVLTVTLPKSAEQQRSRRVAVQADSDGAGKTKRAGDGGKENAHRESARREDTHREGKPSQGKHQEKAREGGEAGRK